MYLIEKLNFLPKKHEKKYKLLTSRVMTKIKNTKIVATISDLNCDVSFIKKLYEEGMNIVRLNTAYQTLDSTRKIVDNIRKVSDKIAILLDTKGPEIRTCPVNEQFELKEGVEIRMQGGVGQTSDTGCIRVMYNDFVCDVPPGSNILIDDGDIELEVINKDQEYLYCKVLDGGYIQSKKSVNVPDVSLDLPSLSPKDKDYIRFAVENDLDFIAHSFVRHKEDILEIQNILDSSQSSIKIIAKIENQQGVDNIDEILDYAYGIMVARGDLAIEITYEKIPVIQRQLISKSIEKRKPVIIATQMLHSMINNPRPTRAEVSDIASAIYCKADAIMLSNETANGLYPVNAVKTMDRVAREVEKNIKPFHDIEEVVLSNEISAFLTKSAVKASVKLNAKAIIADTQSGRTIRNISAFRGAKPIYAQCFDKRVVRELALSYGVFADYMKPRETNPEFITEALHFLKENKHLEDEDLVVTVAGNFGTHHGASFIEVSTVKNLIQTNKVSVKSK